MPRAPAIRMAIAAMLAVTPAGCERNDPTAPGAAGTAATGIGSGRFAEAGLEAGLHFEMSFLPGEQGENFKVNFYDHGCGLAIADVDGDLDDDVYLLNQLGPNGLFRNDGTGRFADIAAEAGVAVGDRVCVAAAFGDVDSDGDQDLYVTSTRGGNLLFRNDGRGRFADVTEEVGLTLVAHSESPSFFDYDRDGDLDLFVTNTAQWTWNRRDAGDYYFEGRGSLFELVESEPERNTLYRNDGMGHFEDVTEAAGVAGAGWGATPRSSTTMTMASRTCSWATCSARASSIATEGLVRSRMSLEPCSAAPRGERSA